MLLGNFESLHTGEPFRQDLEDVRFKTEPAQAGKCEAGDDKQDDDEPEPVSHAPRLGGQHRTAILSWLEAARDLM